MGHLLLPHCRIKLVQSPSLGHWAMLGPAGVGWACRTGAGPVQETSTLSGLLKHQESRLYSHQQHTAGDTRYWAAADLVTILVSALLAGQCGTVPCQGGHFPVPCCHTQPLAHLPSLSRCSLVGTLCQILFWKHKESSLWGCWAGMGEKRRCAAPHSDMAAACTGHSAAHPSMGSCPRGAVQTQPEERLPCLQTYPLFQLWN